MEGEKERQREREREGETEKLHMYSDPGLSDTNTPTRTPLTHTLTSKPEKQPEIYY